MATRKPKTTTTVAAHCPRCGIRLVIVAKTLGDVQCPAHGLPLVPSEV